LRRQSEEFCLREFSLKRREEELEAMCADLRTQNEELQAMLDEMRSVKDCKHPFDSLSYSSTSAFVSNGNMPLMDSDLVKKYFNSGFACT